MAAVDGVATAVAEVRGDGPADRRDRRRWAPPPSPPWIADAELSWLTLSDGRPRGRVGRSWSTRETAERANLSIGDRTTRRPGAGVRHRRRSGDRWRDRNRAASPMSPSRPTPPSPPRRQCRLDHRGRAADGVSAEQLAVWITPALPDGIEAITGAELTAEQQSDIESDFLGFFQTLLMAFAGIAISLSPCSASTTRSHPRRPAHGAAPHRGGASVHRVARSS